MKKLVLSFVFLFSLIALLGFTENLVEAGEPDRLSPFSVTYTHNLNGDTSNKSTISNVYYGDKLQIDLGSHNDFDYVGYIINDKVEPFINELTEITLTETVDIQIFYKPVNSTAVIFMDANQDFLKVMYTDKDGEPPTNYIVESEGNSIPDYQTFSKPGLAANGWVLNGGVVTDLSEVEFTSDSIVYVSYADSTSELNLSVTNGTISESGPYYFNQSITVTANGSGTFNYWLKDNRIISYEEEAIFTMVTNHTLEAVYNEPDFAKPTGNMVYVSESYVLVSGYLTILAQFDLAPGEELVEYGFVYSNSEAEPTLSSNDKVVQYSNKYNPLTNEFVMSFSNSSNPLGAYYRAFVTTKDASNNISVDYSEVSTNTVRSRLYTHYGTAIGQDLYLGYRLLKDGVEVQAWQAGIAASYQEGTTPDGSSYNWYVEILVTPGTQVEWKLYVVESGKGDIWMIDPDRTSEAGRNHFSSWGNEVNEYWYVNE